MCLNEDDIWMNKEGLVSLFQSSRQNIEKHIKHIYEEGELAEEATCNSRLQVQLEGNREVKRSIKYYNLKMIIAIGLRTKSSTATAFRVWANNILQQYMVKGFAIDDKRLEDPTKFGRDYFDELNLRIRAIRESEKRFFQKVLDIYSTSVDYNKNDGAVTKSPCNRGHNYSSFLMKTAQGIEPQAHFRSNYTFHPRIGRFFDRIASYVC